MVIIVFIVMAIMGIGGIGSGFRPTCFNVMTQFCDLLLLFGFVLSFFFLHMFSSFIWQSCKNGLAMAEELVPKWDQIVGMVWGMELLVKGSKR